MMSGTDALLSKDSDQVPAPRGGNTNAGQMPRAHAALERPHKVDPFGIRKVGRVVIGQGTTMGQLLIKFVIVFYCNLPAYFIYKNSNFTEYFRPRL